MRARYTAYAMGDRAYLLATWHPLTRPADVELDAALHWTGLDIERRVNGAPFDRAGVVEFTAHCRRQGVCSSQHEASRFVRIGRRWYYLDAAG